MKHVLLSLAVIAVFVTLFSFPNAYSDFSSDKKYLVQASGYLTGKQNIYDSTLALQLNTATWAGSNLLATLDTGVVTIGDGNYLNSGAWQSTILRYGKYFVITGDSQDLAGNTIHLNLFGRITDSNDEGSVYSISGKITGAETMKVAYSAKVTAIGSTVTQPTQSSTTQNPSSATSSSQTNVVQVNIIPGASTMKTGELLSPSTIQVTLGTTIVIKNSDSTPHQIQSGYITTTTEGSGGTKTANAPQFTADGLIDTGVLAPSQTFQLTVSKNLGTLAIFDPNYSWINGVITSVSKISNAPPVQISIEQGSSVPKGSATQQQFNQYNNYYSPTTVQLTPGTKVIWTNNDSISHTILSGTSTQKPDNPFMPDGKINSGLIAPGKSFQVIINGSGIIRFYDPAYTWMNGVIVSLPPSTSKIIEAPSMNPNLH